MLWILTLSACWNKKINEALNQNINSWWKYITQEISGQIENSVDKYVLNMPIVEKNIEVYTKIVQRESLPEEEKKKVIQKIGDIKKEITKILWEKIDPVAIIAYKENYSKEIAQLEKINQYIKKVKKIDDVTSKQTILGSLDKEKQKIINKLKSFWITDGEIQAIDKFTSLSESEKQKILKDLNDISNYIVPEAGWKIVSPEFKKKYDEAKTQIQLLSEQNWFTWNWPIPYEVVVEYMVKQELIRNWECDKLENDIERAECEWRKKGY